MAKVQKCILCPKCRMEINKNDDSCKYCGFRWQPTTESGYVQPNYIYLQENSVKEDRSVWFKGCPHEAQIAAMEDAFRTLQYLVLSKPLNGAHMKKLTAIGKNIGKLAVAIETYAAEGGQIEFPEIVRTTYEEDSQRID